MGNGRHYVTAKKHRPKPTSFVTVPHIEGRTFTDHHGNSYDIVWPHGQMTISEALRGAERQEGRDATPE